MSAFIADSALLYACFATVDLPIRYARTRVRDGAPPLPLRPAPPSHLNVFLARPASAVARVGFRGDDGRRQLSARVGRPGGPEAPARDRAVGKAGRFSRGGGRGPKPG